MRLVLGARGRFRRWASPAGGRRRRGFAGCCCRIDAPIAWPGRRAVLIQVQINAWSRPHIERSREGAGIGCFAAIGFIAVGSIDFGIGACEGSAEGRILIIRSRLALGSSCFRLAVWILPRLHWLTGCWRVARVSWRRWRGLRLLVQLNRRGFGHVVCSGCGCSVGAGLR